MKTTNYVMASAIIFSLFAIVHLLRLVQGWPVQLGTMAVPLWVSGVAIAVSAGIATWGFSLLRKR